MTPQRYQHINALADAALALDAGRRAAFLDAACAGDQDLRDRVERLLAAGDANGLLDSPALEVLAKDIAARRPVRDLSGRRLGRYALISRLGSGGHSEVWLALDEQLDREVAVKFLADGFANDAAHVRRFQQEARAASALNHPNIVTIHDIGRIEGIDFIAQERVKGQTLRQRLAGGTLALPEVLRIGEQVAAALGAAHSAGIVHRDIKPENIMIRPDGLVKVLDFGLAIFTERGPAGDRAGETLSRPGLVLGTVRYMSPEQARGLAVDARSDIFSLGIMLYEMSTGAVPFAGETPSDTIRAILEREPPPFPAAPAAGSAGLEPVIRRCMAKDRQGRYSARELSEKLRGLADTGSATTPSGTPASARARRTPAWAAVLAGGLLLIGGMLLSRAWSNRESPRAGFSAMQMSRPPTRAKVADAAISADGRYVAYVAGEAAGQAVWLTQLATGIELRIVPPEPGQHSGVTFSPDGAYVYYRRAAASGEQMLYRVSALGGAPQEILDRVSGPVSFSRSGHRLAFVRLDSVTGESSVEVANADGSGLHAVAVRRRPAYYNNQGLAWSPDDRYIACPAGRAAAYSGEAFHLVQVAVAGGAEKALAPNTWADIESMVWLHGGGGLLFNDSERSTHALQIWRVSVPGGRVSRVTNDLDHYARLSLTGDDSTLAALETRSSADLWVAASGPAPPAQVTYGTIRNLDTMAWMPDGRIVYSAEGEEFLNLWILDARGGMPRQLTSGPGDKSNMAVTPDGRSIIYQSMGKIWRVDADGRNPVQLTHGSWDVHPDLSADGRSLFYASFTEWSPAIGSRPTLWTLPAAGGDPIRLTADPASMPKISPDGKRLACLSYPSGDPRFSATHLAVYDLTFAPPRKIFDSLLPDGTDIAWSPNGAAIDYIREDSGAGNVWRQPLAGGPPAQITHFTTGELFRLARSRDGSRLGIARGNTSSELVLIRSFQ